MMAMHACLLACSALRAWLNDDFVCRPSLNVVVIDWNLSFCLNNPPAQQHQRRAAPLPIPPPSRSPYSTTTTTTATTATTTATTTTTFATTTTTTIKSLKKLCLCVFCVFLCTFSRHRGG